MVAAAPWKLSALDLNRIAAKGMRRAVGAANKPAGKGNNDKNVDNPSVQADQRKGPDWQLDPALWDEIRRIMPAETPQGVTLPHQLGVIDGNIKVMLVNGDRVMVEHDMDFVEAGNGAEAPEFIPTDEIWIDINTAAHEWPFNCYHEAHERRCMANQGMSYPQAHERANAVEKMLRLQAMDAEGYAKLGGSNTEKPAGKGGPIEQAAPQATGSDDTHTLANEYATTWNDFITAGMPPSEHEIAEVDAELEGSPWRVQQDQDGKWMVVPVQQQQLATPHQFMRTEFVLQFAAMRAPYGSGAPGSGTRFMVSGGKPEGYLKGQFIPGGVIDKLKQSAASGNAAAKQQIAELEKGQAASEAMRQKSVEARRQRDISGLKGRLAAHAEGQATGTPPSPQAVRGYRALRAAHGELVLHRLDELSEQVQDRINRTKKNLEKFPRGTPQRAELLGTLDRLQGEMGRLHQIHQLAESEDQKTPQAQQTQQAPQAAAQTPASPAPQKPTPEVLAELNKLGAFSIRDDGMLMGKVDPSLPHEARADLKSFAQILEGNADMNYVDRARAFAQRQANWQNRIEQPRRAEQEAAETQGLPPAHPTPKQVYQVNTKDLAINPEMFQYKVSDIDPETGTTGELKSVTTWDPDLAGVVSVWRDPATGKDYVVNGHHRYELADRLGVSDLSVRYIHANTPREARAKGALINIAEGRGTAVDAAKFMRDSGTTPDELASKGVSLKGKVAADGVTLSKLSDHAFQQVTQGILDQNTALAVAQHLDNHEKQNILFAKLQKKEEATGKATPRGEAQEMAREMALSPTTTQADLFGEVENPLFDERAKVRNYLRNALGKRYNDFSAVGSERRAKAVRGAGNVLNTQENKRLAEKAGEDINVFDREAYLRGPVSNAINKAAQELAQAKTKGEKDAVLQRAAEAYAEAASRQTESRGGFGEPGKSQSAAEAPAVQPGGEGGNDSGRGGNGETERAAETAPLSPDQGRGDTGAAGLTPPEQTASEPSEAPRIDGGEAGLTSEPASTPKGPSTQAPEQASASSQPSKPLPRSVSRIVDAAGDASKPLADRIHAAAGMDTRILDQLLTSGAAGKVGIGYNEFLRQADVGMDDWRSGLKRAGDRKMLESRLSTTEKRIRNELVPGLRKLAAEGVQPKDPLGNPIDLNTVADWYEKQGVGLIDELRREAGIPLSKPTESTAEPKNTPTPAVQPENTQNAESEKENAQRVIKSEKTMPTGSAPTHPPPKVQAALDRYTNRAQTAQGGGLFGGEDLQARKGFDKLPDQAAIVFTNGEFEGKTGKVVHDKDPSTGKPRIVAEVDGRPGLVPINPDAVEPLDRKYSWRLEGGGTGAEHKQGGLFTADQFLPKRENKETPAAAPAEKPAEQPAPTPQPKAEAPAKPTQPPPAESTAPAATEEHPLLKHLSREQPLSVGALAEASGLSRAEVAQHLGDLRKQGRVEIIPGGEQEKQYLNRNGRVIKTKTVQVPDRYRLQSAKQISRAPAKKPMPKSAEPKTAAPPSQATPKAQPPARTPETKRPAPAESAPETTPQSVPEWKKRLEIKPWENRAEAAKKFLEKHKDLVAEQPEADDAYNPGAHERQEPKASFQQHISLELMSPEARSVVEKYQAKRNATQKGRGRPGKKDQKLLTAAAELSELRRSLGTTPSEEITLRQDLENELRQPDIDPARARKIQKMLQKNDAKLDQFLPTLREEKRTLADQLDRAIAAEDIKLLTKLKFQRAQLEAVLQFIRTGQVLLAG